MAFSKSNLAQGLTSLLILAPIAWGTYAIYFSVTGGGAEQVAGLLESRWIWVPASLRADLYDYGGGLDLLLAYSVSAVHLLAYAVLAGAPVVLMGLAGHALWATWCSPQRRYAQDMKRAGMLRPPRPRIEPVVLGPERTDAESRVIRGIAPNAELRLDRSRLEFKNPPKTPIARFEAALHEILHAHAHWPADPAGHHASTDLYTHSKDVAARLRAETNNHPLAGAIGLAHDIGKLLAYRDQTASGKSAAKAATRGRWKKISRAHDKLGAFIVWMLPEFQALSERDRTTIHRVLSYAHHREMIPMRGTDAEEHLGLIDALRKEDGIATAQDKKGAAAAVDDAEIKAEVRKSLEEIIPQLNINAYEGGYADGWTMELVSYIAVREEILRKQLAAVLSDAHTQALSLNVPATSKGHPATEVIRSALHDAGLLLEEYDGIIPPRGLFSLKVGIKIFDHLLLLDRDRIEEAYPTMVKTWDDADYPLDVQTRRTPKAPPKS